MRIIGGKFRSRMIKAPVIRETRATKDMVREAVFSAIGPLGDQTTVLDLFAGSGSYGLEALSRGAKRAIMADHNDICVATIKANMATLGAEGGEVWHSDYLLTLKRIQREGIKLDLVILDPPYLDKICEAVIDILIKENLISPRGIIVAETLKEIQINEHDFTKVRRYRYGITRVTIMWR